MLSLLREFSYWHLNCPPLYVCVSLHLLQWLAQSESRCWLEPRTGMCQLRTCPKFSPLSVGFGKYRPSCQTPHSHVTFLRTTFENLCKHSLSMFCTTSCESSTLYTCKEYTQHVWHCIFFRESSVQVSLRKNLENLMDVKLPGPEESKQEVVN